MRYKQIPSSLFATNRKKLKEAIPTNAIALIHSNAQMPRNGDQFYQYRQNSDFFYYTGIDQEKSVLLMDPSNADEKNREVLFILRSNEELETWEGHKLTPSEAFDFSEIKTIKFVDELDDYVHSLIFDRTRLYVNDREHPRFQSEVESSDVRYFQFLKKRYPLHKFERLAPIIAEQRTRKESVEVDIMRKACSITHKAFEKVLKVCKPEMYEYEIEAEITAEFIRNGAMGHAYAPIVASGINACALHYITNNAQCKDGDMLLMDFGAEYANYAADLSRTIPVNGKFTSRQKELYNTTLKVFKMAKKVLKPGTTINAINKHVQRLWEDEHVRLGLYTKSDAAKSEEPLFKKYYPHGVSHFLGLDVHDVGSKDMVLQPGMILTCEPGIYIRKENIGVRIENDVLITENGNIDLMEDIPVEIEELEDIMNS